MYERFFAFRDRPFDLTPNPRFLYLTGKHREALSNLNYGITGRKGVTLLIGEAGTGKTTLVNAAIEMLVGRSVRCVSVNNPALTRAEFYQLLSARFGLTDRAAASKARFLQEVESVVRARHAEGGITALIIDEAQSLPAELMEEVRLLANLETETDKLLPVVLAGQPELAERLECEDMRQLKQRVALRCELLPLDIRETAAYITGRITIAGGDSTKVFTREAVQLIYERSRGIPRTISVICDNALLTAFAAGVKPVGSNIIVDVCRDFHYGNSAQPVAAAAAVGSPGDASTVRRSPREDPPGASGKHPAAGLAGASEGQFPPARLTRPDPRDGVKPSPPGRWPPPASGADSLLPPGNNNHSRSVLGLTVPAVGVGGGMRVEAGGERRDAAAADTPLFGHYEKKKRKRFFFF